MITSFNDFLKNMVTEALHPELKEIVKDRSTKVPKQSRLADKIKELSERGEKTGVEGNMPKGSSRAYLKSDSSHKVNVDGIPSLLSYGTKVAIKSSLDKHHIKEDHEGRGLGQMQNHAENGDDHVNKKYRILKKDENGDYHSNHEHGIFPPLIGHDKKHHHWAQVGHARDIKDGEFNKLTKTESHPEGISHSDFTSAINRAHETQHGKYWPRNEETEKHMDHVSNHPLVKKFIHYHKSTGEPGYDYRGIQNLGVFHHPDGSKHIVARDHGFSTGVTHAYKNSIKKRLGSSLNLE